MIICCDIDGVINNLMERTVDMYNKNENANVLFSDITTYNLYDCFPMNVADKMISLFKDEHLWKSLSPVKESQPGLKTLVENGHKVYLATATDPSNFAYKVEWINKFFPFIPSDNIIRIMDKSLINCDIIIDDCYDNLTNSFAERILVDKPWNQSGSKDYAYDVHRCKTWRDIVKAVNEIKGVQDKWEKE